mgnify:CR=1 FL=1
MYSRTKIKLLQFLSSCTGLVFAVLLCISTGSAEIFKVALTSAFAFGVAGLIYGGLYFYYKLT